MQASNSEPLHPDSPNSLIALPIHGMPEYGDMDPIAQLDPVLNVCSSQGLTILREYVWATGSYEQYKEAWRRLQSENEKDSLVDWIADDFDKWFRKHLEKLPSGSKVAITAFSLGGAGFYRWVSDKAKRKQIRRISVAIMIAAPYNIPNRLWLEGRKRPVRVNGEPAISLRNVVTKLNDEDVRLKVLLGGMDITIPAEDKIALFPDDLEEYQEIIPEATHESICGDRDVLRRVETLIGQTIP